MLSIPCITLFGCSGHGGGGGEEGSLSPAELFAAEVGYSLGEVNAAALSAWASAVESCLTAEGFTPIDGTVPDATSRDQPPTELGNLVHTAAAVGLPPAEPPGTSGDSPTLTAAYALALNNCMKAASDRVVDPTTVFLYWLATEDQDLSSRVHGDRAVVDAGNELATCLTAAGIPATSEDSVNRYFQGRAQSVLDDLMNGVIDRAEAEARLTALAAEESRVAPAGNTCIASYRAVYNDVLQREEGEWVADHVDVVSEKLRDVRDEYLPQLMSFLPPSSE